MAKKDDDMMVWLLFGTVGFFVLKPVLFPTKAAVAPRPLSTGVLPTNTAYVAQQQPSIADGINNLIKAVANSGVFDKSDTGTDSDYQYSGGGGGSNPHDRANQEYDDQMILNDNLNNTFWMY